MYPQSIYQGERLQRTQTQEQNNKIRRDKTINFDDYWAGETKGSAGAGTTHTVHTENPGWMTMTWQNNQKWTGGTNRN